MERRFYLGVAILVLLLVVGYFSGVWVEKTNHQVVQALTQAEEAAEQGDRNRALQFARQAEHQWETSWRQVAVVADHTAMDEIDGLFSQMEHYAREGDAMFGASCARVRSLVSAVSDDHRLTWWNLL